MHVMPPHTTNDDLRVLMEQTLGLLYSIDKKLEAKTSPVPRYDMKQYEALAVELFKKTGRVSTSALQREFAIGYTKAASIVDSLEKQGIVSAPNPDKQNTRELIS